MSNTEVITRLVVDASGAQVGTDHFVAQMRQAQKAHEDFQARITGTVESIRRQFENLQAKTDPVFKAQIAAQREMVKAQELAGKAVKLGVSDQQRADAVMAALTKRHLDLINAAKAAANGHTEHGRAMQAAGTIAGEFNARLQSSASSLGLVGTAMAATGPIGLALAATIGAVALGFTVAARESMRLADDLGKMKDQAETTGISFTGIQGLRKIAAENGVAVDKLDGSLEKLTVGLDSAKDAEGDLYAQILKINAGLAQQLLVVKNNEQAFDLLAKATKAADDEVSKAKLMKAAFGRGGLGMGRVMDAVADAGGISGATALINARDLVDPAVGKILDDLADKITYTFHTARNNVVLAFGKPVLETLDDLSQQFITFSREVRNWKSPDELRSFLKDWIKEAVEEIKSLLGLIGDIASGIGAAIRFIRQQRSQSAGNVDALTGNGSMAGVDPMTGAYVGPTSPLAGKPPTTGYVAASFPDQALPGTAGLMEDIAAARAAVKHFEDAIVRNYSAGLVSQSVAAQKVLADKRRELFLTPSIDPFTGGMSFDAPQKRSAAADANIADRRLVDRLTRLLREKEGRNIKLGKGSF